MATAIPMTPKNAKMIFEKAGSEFYNKETYRDFAASARNWYAVFEENPTTLDPMIVQSATLRRYWKLGDPDLNGTITAIRK